MNHKKNADDQPSAEEQVLQQRVYDLMELDRSKALKAVQTAPEAPVTKAEPAEEPQSVTPATSEAVEEVTAKEATAAEAPIDIFKSLKTKAPIVDASATKTGEPAAPEPEAEVYVKSDEAIAKEPVFVDDESMDKVIDEIVVSESDALLAAEDQLKNLSQTPKTKSKLGRLFKG